MMFIVAAFLVCAVAVGCSSSRSEMTVTGTVQMADNPAAGIYPPVSAGTQVIITDPSGNVIGTATLDGDAPQDGPAHTITFGFTVTVPEGESSYGISVTGIGGTAQYTPAQMRQGPTVCADTACGG